MNYPSVIIVLMISLIGHVKTALNSWSDQGSLQLCSNCKLTHTESLNVIVVEERNTKNPDMYLNLSPGNVNWANARYGTGYESLAT